MEDRRFVKPAEGQRVLNPDAGLTPLPAWGKGVAWTSYWQRRFNEGEIVMTDEASVSAGEKAAERAANKAAKGGEGDAN